MKYVMAAAVMLCASSAAADDTQARLDRLDGAFESWLDQHGTPGVLAVRRGDDAAVVFEHGIDATSRVELASVGKAITAQCAAALVETETLEWSDGFQDIVGRGPDVSLSTLVTHASGLVQDSTQNHALSVWAGQGPDGDLSTLTLQQIMDRDGPKGDAGVFAYNNENYALVGLMIAAATGRDYADVCHDLVLKPAGVTATPSDQVASAVPWGGWTMTPADFAILHAYWFGAKADPEATPFVQAGGGVHYGMGTFFRVLDRGNTFWHFGALCFPGQLQRGSFVATWFGDWTVFAAYETCVDWDAMFALDGALAGAVFGPLE